MKFDFSALLACIIRKKASQWYYSGIAGVFRLGHSVVVFDSLMYLFAVAMLWDHIDDLHLRYQCISQLYVSSVS